jgi:hypothetical protein
MAIRNDRRAGARNAARLLSACSPIALGVFGWLTAHLLTLWLLAHSHNTVVSPTGRHLHHYTASATLLVGCLAAASLLAALVSASPSDRPHPGTSGRSAAIRRAIWISTLAFGAAELTEHALLGADRKPPAILLAGLLLHALAGSLTTLSWRHYHGVVHRIWSMTGPLVAPVSAQPRPVSASAPAPRRYLCGACIAGRAPPLPHFG